jgi:hypothetical protein
VLEPPDVDATVQKIESLLEELRQADPRLQQGAEEIARLLMHLYGCGFARTIEILGSDAAARMAEDKLVSSLLLLHRLHPVSAEIRIQEALARVERRLDGGRIVVAEITDDAARIRVELNGGAAAPPTLAAMIERAVVDAAPDIGGVVIDGLPQPAAALVQIAPAAAR